MTHPVTDTPTLAHLPYAAQRARIHAAAGDRSALLALVDEVADLADPAPFATLVESLAELRPDRALCDALMPRVSRLADPSLAYVYQTLGGPAHEALLVNLAEAAIARWPIDRMPAIAFFARWLRRRAPGTLDRVLSAAEAAVQQNAISSRALALAAGPTLARVADDPAHRPMLVETVQTAIDALARAPKSISQANAEELLARRVYADRGHFVFELLQNADDAEASEWALTVYDDRAEITHDGRPFSFFDVVGVTSIGLTTKRAGQIGFFGVGFKSVYEVCERPRIHSGAFDLEIAHVSIPRVIQRPRGIERGATVLILPFSTGVDPDAVYVAANRIPAQTLLTLPHLRRFSTARVRGSAPASAQRSYRCRKEGADYTLADEVAGTTASYRAQTASVTFDGPREQGRARTSEVLVAGPVDADGTPATARPPTLFAFLPTAERTGLSVLVHARFDVTLDRERLGSDSAWNAELLRAAGECLGALYMAAVADGQAPLAWLTGIDRASSSIRPLAERTREVLAAHACLPTFDHGWVRPDRARRLPSALTDALGPIDLGDGKRALRSLDGPEWATAAWLGARPLSDRELVAVVAMHARPSAPPPSWLAEPVLDALARAQVTDDALRALSLITGAQGHLVPSAEAHLTEPEWAELYAGLRPLVARASAARLPARLQRRLRIPEWPLEQLADDLAAESPLQAALVDRRPQLLSALLDAPQRLVDRLGSTPLLYDTDRRPTPVDGGLWRLAPSLEPLREALKDQVAFVHPELVDAFGPLIRRWVPVFDLRALLAHLEDQTELPPAIAEAVLSVLDAGAESLSAPDRRRFAALPLFEDAYGIRRRLWSADGEGTLGLRPATDDLPAVFRAWPWIQNADRPGIVGLGVAAIDAGGVVERLVVEPASRPRDLDPVLRWLCARAADLPARVVEALASAPIWLDARGALRHLAALRRGGAPEVDAYYATAPVGAVRHPASATTIAAIGALRRQDWLPATDYHAVIFDLLRDEPPWRDDHATDALAAVLEAAVEHVSPETLRPLIGRPMFFDEAGTQRALAAWNDDAPDRCVRPGALRAALASGPRPLLAEADERRWPKFLASVGPPAATVRDLVASLATLADAEAALEVLDAHWADLDVDAQAATARLPIWSSASGERQALEQLAHPLPFREIVGRDRIVACGLEAYVLSDRAAARADRWALAPRPAGEVLNSHVLAHLKPDAPLSEQPAPWTSPDDVAALARLAAHLGLDPASTPAGLDGARRLRVGPLPAASATVRTLLAEGGALDHRLADPEWAAHVPADWLTELPASAVSEALRTRFDGATAAPGQGFDDALWAWLREAGDAIARDPEALSALAAAKILPSQRGDRRPASELVLDSTLPDLGLDWGLADHVPEDVARWLRIHCQLDKAARQAVVDHVLDGLDGARDDDDRARAAALIRFLARSLGGTEVAPDVLEQRARRTKVRARLRVPTIDAEWVKPRFGWSPSPDLAATVERFAVERPPEILLDAIDAPSRALLSACGARTDLDDREVEALLDGDGLRPGLAARRALARYVAARASEDRERVRTWALGRRAWIPNRQGDLRRPDELVWPDPLAEAIGDESLLADPEVTLGLPDSAAAVFGFQRADRLPLERVAELVDGREAVLVLLEWLEDGLGRQRFSTADVRVHLRDRLWLRDRNGRLRRPTALARAGAAALFGPWRGDFADAQRFDRLTKALGIATAPDAPMIVGFLTEIGSLGPDAAEIDPNLVDHVLRAWQYLDELDPKAVQAVLPETAAVVAQQESTVSVRRLDDPRLCLLEPAELADALPDERLDALAEPLPDDRTAAQRAWLWRANVKDLATDLHVERVLPGPEVVDEEALARAKAMHAGLRTILQARIGSRIVVVEHLAVQGRHPLANERVTVSTEAGLVDGTLWLTPQTVHAPERLAWLLAPQPKARAAMDVWLKSGDWRTAARTVRRPPTVQADKADRSPPRAPWWRRLTQTFGSTDAEGPEPEANRKPAAPRGARRHRAPNVPRDHQDRRFFEAKPDVQAQLRNAGDWLTERQQAPEYGFRFSPTSLPAPWVYAPKQVAVRFEVRGQRYIEARLTSPPPRGQAGQVEMRGRLPEGTSILPVPHYARVETVMIADAPVRPFEGPNGAVLVSTEANAEVSIRLSLGDPPSLDEARVADLPEAIRTTVPDDEVPEEASDFLADLDPQAPAAERAMAVRDFVRRRYRYDPSYLEDPSIAEWLNRLTRGRAHAHIAALHASADGDHLGAGVCYELNTWAAELMRRAAIPSAIVTGWVLDGGALSEPDHLWALALLASPCGRPVWVPIDASSTLDGRPLTVQRRPPGRFRRPKQAEPPPARRKWAVEPPRRSSGRAKPKRRIPRTELRVLARYLARLADRPLTDDELSALENDLRDRDRAAEWLARWLGK